MKGLLVLELTRGRSLVSDDIFSPNSEFTNISSLTWFQRRRVRFLSIQMWASIELRFACDSEEARPIQHHVALTES